MLMLDPSYMVSAPWYKRFWMRSLLVPGSWKDGIASTTVFMLMLAPSSTVSDPWYSLPWMRSLLVLGPRRDGIASTTVFMLMLAPSSMVPAPRYNGQKALVQGGNRCNKIGPGCPPGFAGPGPEAKTRAQALGPGQALHGTRCNSMRYATHNT